MNATTAQALAEALIRASVENITHAQIHRRLVQAGVPRKERTTTVRQVHDALEAAKISVSWDGDKAYRTGAAEAATPDAPVSSAVQRRLAALPPDTRPLPSVAVYDQLLKHRPRPGSEGLLP